MITKSSKLTPELSNPYVPGRCWRKISDTENGTRMCNSIGVACNVYKKPKSTESPVGSSVVMWLCYNCQILLEKSGYIVRKTLDQK